MQLKFSGFYLRKSHGKGCSAAGRAFNGDGAAKAFDDGFDNCQAKTIAFIGTVVAVRKERFKDVRQVGRGNAFAIVGNGDGNMFFVFPADADVEFSVVVHGMESILNQINKNHLEIGVIAQDADV